MFTLWVVVAGFVLYGLSCLVFALVDPPRILSYLYRVPAVFVFLPDRLAMPVGRAFVGICSLGVAAFMVVRVLSVM
ncbi:MAG: hypothetical protein JW751_08740 [Polyangiaceae bacterium]|nr:hypothetical protein [Polyangiaceae bacterium]